MNKLCIFMVYLIFIVFISSNRNKSHFIPNNDSICQNNHHSVVIKKTFSLRSASKLSNFHCFFPTTSAIKVNDWWRGHKFTI